MRPIGDWSTTITLSIFSTPVISEYVPGFTSERLSFRASAFCRISFTRLDFPLPETPVTQVNIPAGNPTVIFFRLCSRAPFTTIILLLAARLFWGISIFSFPDKYRAVIDCFDLITFSNVPDAAILPPCFPAPGPISTIQSALRIVSSSCSTAITVLPRSRNCSNVLSNRPLSRWCNPIDGSSKIYRTPVSDEPSCDASRILCASPPASVGAARSSVKYPSPTSSKNLRRFSISFNTRATISCWRLANRSLLKNSRVSDTDILLISPIFFPPILTNNASCFNRIPLQTRHGLSEIYFSISRRTESESVFL